MPSQKGSSTVEYIIPVALVALVVGLGVYYISSSGNLLGFMAGSSNMKVDEAAQKVVIGSGENLNSSLISDKSIVKKEITFAGAEEIATKKTCNDGLCTIDFGGVILNGLPEDFNEFVKATGASGSTKLLANLVSQIADQLEEDGLKEESEEIKKLASLGHNLAVLQNYAESAVSNCNGETSCIQAMFESSMTVPDNYNVNASPFPANISYNDLAESLFDIGRARNYKTTNPEEFKSNLSAEMLGYLFVDQYDSIANNSSISSSVKGILQELYWDIGIISEDFDNNLSSLLINDNFNHYDPITGSITASGPLDEPLSSFINYNASKITHFDSALICASGNNKDSGTKCH